MGQEYSQGGFNSVSYPEAIGYIERNRLKGRNKYSLKKVEIKSFSNIPYSKYVPLKDRDTKTYKQSLKRVSQNNTNDERKPGGRIVNIAPPGKSPINRRRYAPNTSATGQKGKNPVSNYKDKSVLSKPKHNDSMSSQGSQLLNTSNSSSKKESSGSTVSLRERNVQSPGSATSTRSNFIPRNNKEAQLQKIYIKSEDLVVEMPKRSKKSGKKFKSENGDSKTSKKKKALYKIRKKMKIDPQPVYLESPFKRQKTIRIKKNQIVPAILKQKQSGILNDTKSSGTRPSTSKTIIKRPSTFSNQRPGSSTTSVQLDVLGTKASLFNKDSNGDPPEIVHDNDEDGDDKDELTKLFERRTHFPPKQPIDKSKPKRPRTVSESDMKAHIKTIESNIKGQKNNAKSRPKSSPYRALPVVYPGYKGKTATKGNLSPKKKASKSAIHPLSSKKVGRSSMIKGKVGDLNIVKGKHKNVPKNCSEEPKVRLKWYNVLHRTHYQNRIGSLYNKQEGINVETLYMTEDNKSEMSYETELASNNTNETIMNSPRSVNTYSDSCLSNTIVSTANATVVGQLDHSIAEVDYEPNSRNSKPDYEPSLTSEFSVFSTRQTRVSGLIDYEGDGETDLDRPLRFKDKKSPDVLRKDLLKLQEIHFKNHPGVEEETDSSDSGTLTEDHTPVIGHVQKMRELFGAIEHNQKHPHTRPLYNRKHECNESAPQYKPSFMNENVPSHLFIAKPQKQDTSKIPSNVVGLTETTDTNQKTNLKTKGSNSIKPIKTVKTEKSKPVKKSPVQKQGGKNGIKNTFITQDNKAKHTKIPYFLKESTTKTKPTTAKKITQSKQVIKQAKTPVNEPEEETVMKYTPARQIIVSPVHSDDNDSLADLDDAATLAVKIKSSNTNEQDNPKIINHQYVGNVAKTTDPQKQKEYQEEDELDKILNEILNEQKRREERIQQKSKLVNKQEDGPFRIETVPRLNPMMKENNNTQYKTNELETENKDTTNDVHWSADFHKARAKFEQNKDVNSDEQVKPKFARYQNGSDDPKMLSSDKAIMIEGNYDEYARKTRSPNIKENEKGGFHLPRLVNKEAFAIYSRHGPVQSKNGPSLTQNKLPGHGKDKSISALAETYKGPRFNGYSWRSNTTGNTGANSPNKSLFNTLVQNRYQTGDSGGYSQSNRTVLKSVNVSGGLTKRSSEATKF